MFSNLSIYAARLPGLAPEQLADQLSAGVLSPCGRLEPGSAGWVSPYGRDSDVLTHIVGRCVLFRFGIEEKVLPPAVVKEAVSQRLLEAERKTGQRAARAEKLRVKDEVLMDLLPRAFVKPRHVDAYLDLEDGWLVVDTASRKTAEDLLGLLRMNVTGITITAPDAKPAICRKLTAWLQSGDAPQGFTLGEECDLRDERDASATIRCRRQELERSDIRRHVEQGMQAFRLGLVWQDRLSFSVTEELSLLRVKALDQVQSQLSDIRTETALEELDARFALFSLEFRALLEQLCGVLDWPGTADA
ncbi:MAG: recombination-associated protein RdgC [Pseudomonadota bacterium]